MLVPMHYHLLFPMKTWSFLSDLNIVETSLRENKGARLAEEKLTTLIRSVKVFGFHLATVDLRQSSDIHEVVVKNF
ncbi:MAG: hypothetical protein CM15mP58_11550 [Burkholderiaceae bacterium]|nr:MAG: hypothetical protein CM15mP58_11550 [Burkholderiaceae bacterium]